MLAVIAAVLLVLGVIVPDVDPRSPTFWLLLGVAAIALHLAFPIDVRRRPPSDG